MFLIFKSEGSSLEEVEEAATGLLEVEVGESDIEVVVIGAIGVELELSASNGSRLGVAVLDTGEGYPEISWHAIALLPVFAGDALVNIWLLDGGVLLGLLRGEASSVVGLLFEIPSVELVVFPKAVHGGPGNIEVLSDLVFVGSPLNLRVAASRDCAIGA